MSRSKTSPKSTPAGVVLSAEARSRLQQVADWMEKELEGNQDPRIRLEHCGSVVTNTATGITCVSPFGVLIQMFQPFTLAEAKQLMYGLYVAPYYAAEFRAAAILGIDHHGYLMLLRYLYDNDMKFPSIIKALRTLK